MHGQKNIKLVTGVWRKLLCEKLRHISWILRNKRMAKWAGHVARVGDNKNVTWLWGYLKERDRLEDVGLGLKELGWKDVNAIQLARGRDQWQVLVNVLTDLHVHKMLIYWLAEDLLVFQEGLLFCAISWINKTRDKTSTITQLSFRAASINRIKFQLPFNNIKWLSDYSRRWQVKG